MWNKWTLNLEPWTLLFVSLKRERKNWQGWSRTPFSALKLTSFSNKNSCRDFPSFPFFIHDSLVCFFLHIYILAFLGLLLENLHSKTANWISFRESFVLKRSFQQIVYRETYVGSLPALCTDSLIKFIRHTSILPMWFEGWPNVMLASLTDVLHAHHEFFLVQGGGGGR